MRVSSVMILLGERFALELLELVGVLPDFETSEMTLRTLKRKRLDFVLNSFAGDSRRLVSVDDQLVVRRVGEAGAGVVRSLVTVRMNVTHHVHLRAMGR
jgi:hypothetical protein